MKKTNNKLHIIIVIISLVLILFCFNKETREQFINYDNYDYSDNMTINDIQNLKSGQQILTNMLRQFDRICRKHNLKYWAIGGTLIGAIRHQGWIPWDGDVDIGMLDTDYAILKNVIHHELPKTMEFTQPTNKVCSKLRSKEAKYINTSWGYNWDVDMGIQLDVFVFKHKDNNITSGSPVAGIPDKTSRPYSDIFPVKELMFENIPIYVPNEYQKISRELWGGFPPELLSIEKRFPHEGRIEFI